ncbi:MAG: ATP-binding cassette domain-containing protein, partial [Pseudomonadota bacterium]
QSLSIVGPSGSGKTSLLMVMAGLEPATGGQIEIEGTDIAPLDEDARARLRARRIGIIFQSFHLIPSMTALENVAVPLQFAGRSDAFEVAKARLSDVGLGDRVEHFPTQLSGGEQQRVAIARALSNEPAIVFADEPTGNLDQATGETVVDLLFKLQRERGVTLVLITHDRELAAQCDRSIALRDGQVVSDVPRQAAA